MITAHIVNDIKRINANKHNEKINKEIQNFFFQIMKSNSDVVAKKVLLILIELYNKFIWRSDKTVNIIASGCLNTNPKIKLISAYFLIETTEGKEELEEDDDLGVESVKEMSKKFGRKIINEAKAKRDKKRLLKRIKRKMQVSNTQKSFFPIDLIYNPQDFAEKVFDCLKNSKDKFEAKIVIMKVLSRLIGRHKLIILNFYTYIQKYLNSYQKEVPKILAILAESVHDIIPENEMQSTLKIIFDNFINERCTEEAMTLGINTVKEIASKNPNILDESSVNYVAEHKDFRNKNVAKAAKSFINLMRDLNPEKLHKKFRGFPGENAELLQKAAKVNQRIHGADLLEKALKKKDGIPIEFDKILDDKDFRRIQHLQKNKKFLKENQSVSEEEGEGIDEEEEENEGSMMEIDSEDLEFDENSEEENPEQNESEMEVEEKSSDYSSQSEEENPHGFVSENMISNFKRSKADRKRLQLEQIQANRKEKKYFGPKEKGGGSNNREKQKHKPLMMMRAKKNQLEKMTSLKKHIKKIKTKLGHVRSKKQANRKRLQKAK